MRLQKSDYKKQTISTGMVLQGTNKKPNNMKKLFYSGLMALTMLFAIPGVVRADDGDASTVPTPTFTPTSGSTVAPGDVIDFTLPTEYASDQSLMVCVLYTFDASASFEEFTYDYINDLMGDMAPASLTGMNITMWFGGASVSDDEDEEEVGMSGAWTPTIQIPADASGTLTMRAHMVVIDAEENVTASEMVTATYTVEGEAAPVVIEAPTFDPADGTAVTAGTEVSVVYSGEKVDWTANATFAVLYVLNNPDFDFSQYKNYDTDVPGNVVYQDPIAITQNTTITAITVKYDMDSEDIIGWSEKVSASYTVKPEEPAEGVFTITPGPQALVSVGEKIEIEYAASELIFYQWFADEATAKAAATGMDAPWVTYMAPNYMPEVTVEKPVLRVIAFDEDDEETVIADTIVVYENINTPSSDPTLAVTAAVATTVHNDTIIFNGMASFSMKVNGEIAENDTLTLTATLWTKENYANYFNFIDEDNTPITDFSYFVTANSGYDTLELIDAYNGDYVLEISLAAQTKAGMTTLDETTVFFRVTNYEDGTVEFDEPTLTVEAAGKFEMEGDKVVFDSVATFKMKVTGLSEGDALSNYTLTARIYDETSGEWGAIFDEEPYAATDTLATFIGIWNGEYSVDFFLTRITGKMPEELTATTIFFNVTNYAEPVVVDPEFTVAAAGKNEVVGDTVVVFDGAAAFKMNVGEITEGDSLKISAEVWTKAAYFDMDNGTFDSTYSYAVTDTLAEFAGVYNGEYAVVFRLERYSIRNREFAIVTDTTIFFNVTNNEEPLAVERNSELAGVNVYPNPNAGAFNVVVPERARIDIFGLNGAKVLSREVNAGVEAFSLTHSGIYFVRVMAGNKTAVKRVVVR